MEPSQILIYIAVAIFGLLGILTVLSLVWPSIIKDDASRNTLFKLLILEIVGICITSISLNLLNKKECQEMYVYDLKVNSPGNFYHHTMGLILKNGNIEGGYLLHLDGTSNETKDDYISRVIPIDSLNNEFDWVVDKKNSNHKSRLRMKFIDDKRKEFNGRDGNVTATGIRIYPK